MTGKATITIHQAKWGTFHSPPGAEPAYTIEDNSGHTDIAPSCDECGDCRDECGICHARGAAAHSCVEDKPELHAAMTDEDFEPFGECGGISGRYLACLDGGESLCMPCGEKKYDLQIQSCDCP